MNKIIWIGVILILSFFKCNAQSIEKQEEKLNSKNLSERERIEVLNLLSRDLSFIDPIKSVAFANRALKLSIEDKYQIGIAYAYRNLSNVYTHNENYFLSMEYLQRALDIFALSKDSVGIANCYISLGHTYRKLYNHKEEISYHKKALEIFSRLKIAERIGVTSHNLGESYFNNSEYEKSEALTLRAIKINDSLDNKSVLSACYKVMGLIAYRENKIKKAESYFKEVLKLSLILGDKSQKVATVESLVQLASISKQGGDRQQQLIFLKMAADFSRKHNLPSYLKQIYSELILHFSISNNQDEVRKNLQEFNEVSAAMALKQLGERSELIKSVVQIHNLEGENKKLEQNNIGQALRLERRNTLLVLVIFCAFVLTWIIMKLFKANARIKSSNQILKDQNEIIETQRKNLEELNHTKDKFFSIVAHDLRSPLGSLKLFSGLLMSQLDSISRDEIISMSGRLHAMVDNTIKMTDNLIAWSRIQRKDYDFQPEKIQISEVLENVCSVYRDVANGKSISFQCTINKELSVFADKNHLTFIVRNLLNNAIKFTRRGGWVKLTADVSPKGNATISISDNGIGMTEDIRKNLFSIGKTRSANGTDGEKGTGLGLMLIHEFINLNNGSIEIESEINKGTTFIIRMKEGAL